MKVECELRQKKGEKRTTITTIVMIFCFGDDERNSRTNAFSKKKKMNDRIIIQRPNPIYIMVLSTVQFRF